ncbi:hypothetical protein MRX96_039237 [Rhipicephalus microplus]
MYTNIAGCFASLPFQASFDRFRVPSPVAALVHPALPIRSATSAAPSEIRFGPPNWRHARSAFPPFLHRTLRTHADHALPFVFWAAAVSLRARICFITNLGCGTLFRSCRALCTLGAKHTRLPAECMHGHPNFLMTRCTRRGGLVRAAQA